MQNMTAFNDMAKRYNISLELKRIQSNPIFPEDSHPEGVAHYRCRLSMPGKEIDVYLSGDTGSEGVTTASDVLYVLAMDASGCKMLEEYTDIRDEWRDSIAGTDGNLDALQAFWEEYTGRCMQTEQLRAFLGDDGYDELLRNFGIEDAEMASV
ncbi:MAG: hypothetical protein ABFD98_19100 [Syntrophobacteraceae bacterium]|nr:hypothetical protein [Desulfobacteraceae bacterium]